MDIVGNLVNRYRKSRRKPLRGTLVKVYRAYRAYRTRVARGVTICERDGIKYELDLGEMIDNCIYFDGCFELDVVRICERHVKPGMVVLDIGANIGAHTFRLAKLAGPNGKVISVEPMSFAFSKLVRNAELNDFRNIVFEKIGLASSSAGASSLEFYCSWPVSGGRQQVDSQLHPVHKGRKMKDTVDLVSLDDYVSQRNIQKIDFVKLDVDGYEYEVIAGGSKTFAKWRPVMVLELAWENANLRVLINHLYGLGYSFNSTGGHRYADDQEVIATVQTGEFVNFLLTPQGISS